MGKTRSFLITAPLLFPALFLFALDTLPGIIPEALVRPQYGEAPRFPRDYVIGELGQGEAPEEAYQYARSIAAALMGGGAVSVSIPEEELNRSREAVAALGPRAFRIGGGRYEADGSVSFLIRFLGREQALSGEIYLRTVNQDMEDAEAGIEAPQYRWQAEDILLEEAAPLLKGVYGPGSADMTVYEKFF
ncbi:MAG: hypothetical protein LBQ44_07580 [Treponema sp.]|jgi:hypothetical protein|nr:hypothetical protein [Treponema sp.]